MKNTNLPYLQDRYASFWKRENHDRPLLALVAPEPEASQPLIYPKILSYEQVWLDFSRTIATTRSDIARTRFLGEAFPYLSPNLGPDILGAILGCGIEFSSMTSWAIHTGMSIESQQDLYFDEENIWWQRIRDLTRLAVQDAGGEYLVGITDLHAGLDALVSLFSPQNVCYGLVDCPEKIEKLVWQIFDVFCTVYERLYSMTKTNQEGSTCNWMGVFHPGRWYVTSCDLICMLSTNDFRRFVLPELVAELEFLDASLFHLDGPGALHHLDDLLALPKLNGIQWVPGAGAAPARDWVPTLKKIQAAGKLIQMTITPEDYLILANALEPEGVMYNCQCTSIEQAEAMLAYRR